MTLGSNQPQRFAILDRDGTIIEECNYLSNPDQVQLIPGAAEAIRGMRDGGMGVAVVTNQSGVGRGYFDLARLEEIHQRMCQMLEDEGVHLDGIYFCPHTPDDACNCRKPKPGMIEQAAKELKFDPADCLVVGDRESDIEMGQNVGATTFLVATGYGAETASKRLAQPDYLVNDLLEASQVMKTLVSQEQNSVNPSKLS
ncbi:MAG: D-glycero-beta-D-manno-heptose 1,7-bisphosphate 7-phosphatase [Chloroflexi bacterium]|nr:D-glycero-beta-D-manno-heptose 1,7-bisphosphate 7-phosphatase [Chloroflexota bacterium]